jgi:protein TonB
MSTMSSMNLSRNEYIIIVGVILTHALLIALGLRDKSETKDSSDVIKAQLIQPPPSGAPSSPPAPPQPVKSEPKKPTPPTKEVAKTLSPDGTKAAAPEKTSSQSAPPTLPNSAPTGGTPGGAPQAPVNVDLNQLVILYKPDTEAFYPSFSKKIGEEGNVEVRIQIDEAGNVQAAQVALSSGSPRLDKAATELAQKIRFKPHTQNGVPIKIFAKIGVKFKLKD